ncbi:MAG: FAD-dependent oxidoreductase, partial [Acidobacteriota bacterium]
NRVELRCDHRVENLDDLFDQGYQAVFIALGTCIPRALGIPGEDLPGVWKGVYFLKESNLGFESGRRPQVGNRVAVIGAGNVAVDCARTALRLGAADVRVLYRRSRREMPAYDFEMRAAEIEGAKVELLTAPTRIVRREDGALDLRLTRTRLGSLDAGGRPIPQPIPGSEYGMTVDTVLVAIGQLPGVSDTWNLGRNPDGSLTVEEGSLKTTRPGVFAGGDVVLGPQNIITAIAQGRKAAREIDRYLGGSGDIEEVLAPVPGPEMEYPDIHPHGKDCVAMAELPPGDRTRSFEVVQQGYSEEEARDEALRCVRCDLWSLKGAPKVWWKRRGLTPYWLGGDDRRSRAQDQSRASPYRPYRPRYDHAPYVPDEYSPRDG